MSISDLQTLKRHRVMDHERVNHEKTVRVGFPANSIPSSSSLSIRSSSSMKSVLRVTSPPREGVSMRDLSMFFVNSKSSRGSFLSNAASNAPINNFTSLRSDSHNNIIKIEVAVQYHPKKIQVRNCGGSKHLVQGGNVEERPHCLEQEKWVNTFMRISSFFELRFVCGALSKRRYDERESGRISKEASSATQLTLSDYNLHPSRVTYSAESLEALNDSRCQSLNGLFGGERCNAFRYSYRRGLRDFIPEKASCLPQQ
ncbi:hypothetical protein Ccrd_002767 [Cynara cardunculus var. scolymus]|uniref:Uncharacterized protein n=1 Tax=Cynara cardunculus var. scolymus TaxID=59895 RepID=A0A124SCX7_CYNCS|nr:hypothetical protein Ccrd_002767 [Cynara cardunculus var. scolymus]